MMNDRLIQLKKVLDGHYRCFEYCAICQHRNNKHWANCMECCPVMRDGITMENYFKRFEYCSVCPGYEINIAEDCINNCPVRRGEVSGHLIPAGVESDNKGNLTVT